MVVRRAARTGQAARSDVGPGFARVAWTGTAVQWRDSADLCLLRDNHAKRFGVTKRLSLSVAAALVIAGLFAVAGFAQTDPRGKSHTLYGSVEGINDFAQSI